MLTWDEYRMVCVHGVREGLDSHDCPRCLEWATAEGRPVSKGETYLYVEIPERFRSPAQGENSGTD